MISKILTFAWKAINKMAPEYICDLIKVKAGTRTLRSNNKNLLFIPDTKLVTYGDRSFSKAAPTLWNNLPQNLRQIENY